MRADYEKIGALDTDKKVITYCGGGLAASLLAFELAVLGRNDVAVYDASMYEWGADDSLPIEVDKINRQSPANESRTVDQWPCGPMLCSAIL